jgi:uncharacterized membrane protein
MSSETATPNTVFTTTATAATWSDRVTAATASGAVIDSTNSPIPSSKVRPTMTSRGRITRTLT